ncbi:MAG: hypothetical protein PUG54_09445 [Firmicutes bacterium]|nr:hypothetical protein [Bacillota bacterium]
MFYSLGKINLSILNNHFENLMTDETIITKERIQHIKNNHPEDIELFEKYGKLSVENPDLIIQDLKHERTVFMIKQLPDTNLNVVVRLVLQGENESLKNSVMTFYRIREKNLKKLIDKHELLYIK